MAQCEQCRTEIPEESRACPACGSPHAEVPDELIGRELLGRYRVVRLLAEGGMGRVYLAEQLVGTVARRVAVKVLRRQLGDDRQLVSRFSREAETLVRLTHPNTVQLFDFGALPDGTLALVMEYVEGHSLARELAQGPLPLARVERLLVQIGGALKEAHAHGIVHRDLKPDNLLIADRAGHGDFVKVLDFGIAKVSAADDAKNTKLTQQGMIIGTPPYMSPEQFSGEAVDARSDVYSLGVIVYEMLTGKLPFVANTPWEWASRHLTTDPMPLPLEAATDLLPRHAAAVRKALAKRVEDRPQSVDEFLALFSGAPGSMRASSSAGNDLREETASSTLPELAGSSARPRLLRRTALAIGALACVGFVVGLVSLRAGSSSALRAPTREASSAQAGAPNLPAPHPSGLSTPDFEPREAAAPRPAGGASNDPRAPSARVHRREHLKSAREDKATVAEPNPAGTPSPPPAAAGFAPEPASPPLREAPPAAPAPEQPEPAPRPATARVEPPRRPPSDLRPSSSAQASTSAPVPGDLQQRIAQIQATAPGRLETALGLYQAAASRYGAHPALASARAELARAAEPRLKTLLSQSRCAQAQALQRALNAISAGTATGGLFGGRCPPP